jgi:hypothetical protein
LSIGQFLRRTALPIALGSMSLLGLGAGHAAADSSTALPVSSHTDIVVDGENRQVFISDAASDSIVVTDYDGAVVKQITAVPGASGLTLSKDGETLYAAASGADAIAAIDTGTLQETERYAIGAGTRPQQTALAGGKLWFGYGDSGDGNLGSLDLSGSEPVVTLDQEGPHNWYGAPLLASSPGDPGVLVAGAAGQSPTEVAVYDTASGTPQSQAYSWDPGEYGSSNLRDLAVTADGKEVILASGYPYRHQAFHIADLAPSTQYPTDSYPNAVAVSPNGTVAAGIDGAYSPDVYVFSRGRSTALRNYDFSRDASGSITRLQPGGLAWAPDGSRVFAVTVASSVDGARLQVLKRPGRTGTTLTTRGPESSPRNQELTLTGELHSTTSFASGTTVQVSRIDDPSAGEGTFLGTATVAPDGSFSYTDRPKAKGEVRYTFFYRGDAYHTDASGFTDVNIISE